MSEYQSYEFLAIDRLLTQQERSELRAISSRAEITPTSFSNEYNWGDLKADPAKLLERYFDLHIYLTNWGTRRLAMKLPIEALSPEEAAPYFVGDCATVRRAGKHTIIDLWSEREEFEDWDEVSGWMGAIAGCRNGLLRGDLRALYLAWLLSIQYDEVDPDDVEPAVPPGLENLPVSLRTMAALLRIDEHLIAAAAEGSEPEEPDPPGLAEWIARLPVDEKDTLLHRVACGEHVRVEVALARGFRDEARTGRSDVKRTRRTVGELLTRAGAILEAWEEEQARRAAEARRQREAASAAAREKHLDALATRKAEAWTEIERLVSATKPKYYDLAVTLLLDLRDLAVRDRNQEAFRRQLDDLRGRHNRKPSFIARLDRVGVTAGGR